MARFMVQAAHTNEECLKTMDEIAAFGWDAIDRYDFGCAVGDHSNHVCFGIIEAPNKATALEALPEIMRPKATLTEVAKVTNDELLSYHK